MLDRPNSLRRIAIFTGRRGGFGARLRIMRLIEADPTMELEVIVSDMHPTFGAAVKEVRSQTPISKVAIDAAPRPGVAGRRLIGRSGNPPAPIE
jgi:hypothetical protein